MHPPAAPGWHHTRGFTLIELVMVLVLVGVLAVFVLPTLNPEDFKARGMRDETTALLRYAQKTAVAQRRVVCVVVQSTGLVLTIDNSTPPTGACNSALNLPQKPKGGQGLSASVSDFMFTPMGSTNQSGNITLNLTGQTPITVEANSGYVHD
jgi:MSHA pilin protein MshC